MLDRGKSDAGDVCPYCGRLILKELRDLHELECPQDPANRERREAQRQVLMPPLSPQKKKYDTFVCYTVDYPERR